MTTFAFWRRNPKPTATADTVAPEPVARPTATAQVDLEIAPNDPLLAYLQSAPGVVEVDKLQLVSDGLAHDVVAETVPAPVHLLQTGEAGDWVLGGGGKLGSELPMNTHGGLLRQAHLGAMHHIVEAALQLRGEADDSNRGGGNHQVPDAKLAITNGSGGILAATSALVLSSEPPSA